MQTAVSGHILNALILLLSLTSVLQLGLDTTMLPLMIVISPFGTLTGGRRSGLFWLVAAVLFMPIVALAPGTAPAGERLGLRRRTAPAAGAGEPLGRIFEAFSQPDQGRDRSYGGSGLRLAISARLMELMGGELRLVSSHVGRGSSPPPARCAPGALTRRSSP